jgi:hypothetical protein
MNVSSQKNYIHIFPEAFLFTVYNSDLHVVDGEELVSLKQDAHEEDELGRIEALVPFLVCRVLKVDKL